MNKLPIVFHVGYQKCASTYIQNSFFGRHPEILNLGKGSDSFDKKLREMLINEPLLNETVGDEISDYWSKLSYQTSNENKRVIVYSQENLADFFGIDSGMIAKRLHELAPEAKIIFIIRNQFDFLSSIYTHNVAVGKMSMSIDEWIHFQNRNMKANSWLHHADFYNTVSQFDGLFGAKNVKVYFVEDLKTNQNNFIQDMCHTLGVDPDVGIKVVTEKDRMAAKGKNKKMARQSRWAILTRRYDSIAMLDKLIRPLTNQKLRSFIGKISGLNRNSHSMLDESIHQYISNKYANNNQLLAKRLNKDLSVYGFPL